MFSEWPKIRYGETPEEGGCEYNSWLKQWGDTYHNFYGNGLIPGDYINGLGFGRSCETHSWMYLMLEYKIVLYIAVFTLIAPSLGLYYIIALIMRGCCFRHACERPFQRKLRYVLVGILVISLLAILIAYITLLQSSMKLKEMKGGSHTYTFHYFGGVSTQIRYVLVQNFREFETEFKQFADGILNQFSKNVGTPPKPTEPPDENAGGSGGNPVAGPTGRAIGGARGGGIDGTPAARTLPSFDDDIVYDEDAAHAQNRTLTPGFLKPTDDNDGSEDVINPNQPPDNNDVLGYNDDGDIEVVGDNEGGNVKPVDQNVAFDNQNQSDLGYVDDTVFDVGSGKVVHGSGNSDDTGGYDGDVSSSGRDAGGSHLRSLTQGIVHNFDPDINFDDDEYYAPPAQMKKLSNTVVKARSNPLTNNLFRSIHEIRADAFSLRTEFAMLKDYLRFFNRNASLYLMWHPTGMRAIQEAGLSGIERRSIKYRDIDKLDKNMRDMDDMATRIVERRALIRSMPSQLNEKQRQIIENFRHSMNSFFLRYGRLQESKADNVDDRLWETYTELEKSQTFKLPKYLYDYGFLCAITILVIIILLSVGLVFGIFGVRTYHSRLGFTKETGGKILLLAIFLILITFPIFNTVSALHFFFGVVASNGICDEEYLEKGIHKTNTKNQKSIYYECTNTDTIYKKLKEHDYILDQPLKNDAEFARIVDAMAKKVSDAAPLSRSVLRSTKAINKIINSAAKFRNGNLCKTLRKQLQLPHMQNTLRHLRDYLTESKLRSLPNKILPWGPELRERAVCAVEFFDRQVIGDHIKGRMIPKLLDIEENCLNIKKKFPEGIIRTVRRYMSNGDRTLRILARLGRTNNQELSVHLKNEFTNKIQEYNDYVANALSNEIGKCYFIPNDYKTLTEMQCTCLCVPLKGYWASAFMIIFFLIPTTISAMALANLFRKSCVDYERRHVNLGRARPKKIPPKPPQAKRVRRDRRSELFLDEFYPLHRVEIIDDRKGSAESLIGEPSEVEFAPRSSTACKCLKTKSSTSKISRI